MDQICSKRVFPVKNEKSGQHYWILHVRISVDTKFHLKLIILIFLDQIFPQKSISSQKRHHWIQHIQIRLSRSRITRCYGTSSPIKGELTVYSTSRPAKMQIALRKQKQKPKRRWKTKSKTKTHFYFYFWFCFHFHLHFCFCFNFQFCFCFCFSFCFHVHFCFCFSFLILFSCSFLFLFLFSFFFCFTFLVLNFKCYYGTSRPPYYAWLLIKKTNVL